jgi:hypothetical protein
MSNGKEKVLQALTSSPHRWRTARAIAKETRLSIAETTAILERLPEITRARKGSNRGEALYARKEKRAVAEVSDTPAYSRDSTTEEGQPLPFKFLVLLPFDASAKRLRDAINTTIRQARGEPVFLDEIRAGAVWVDEVSRLISASDAVIADVTRLNPNVMFELGLAHGLGKPFVLLLDGGASTNLPGALLGYQYLTYSPENLSSLMVRLSRTVTQIVQRREAR